MPDRAGRTFCARHEAVEEEADHDRSLTSEVNAAFVARLGKVLDPPVPRPDVVGADLAAVAEAILQPDR